MGEAPAAAPTSRAQITTDLIVPAHAAGLGAALDRDVDTANGSPLPHLWHWLYFWSHTRQADLGPDGHAKKGEFLPDLGLPRRMWAGGRLRFHAPLQIGANATRRSTIAAVEHKEGRSGRLGFVTVRHEISSNDALLIEEEHDIVYREHAVPGAPVPPPQAAPDGGRWQKQIHPTEVLLFRYSALTFNGHRIHYDKLYCREVEGYPDVVVHGPLIATLLMELIPANLPDARVLEFSFKAVRPTFLGHSFTVCGEPGADGKTIVLWAKDHEGWLTMSARAVLA